MQEQRHPPTQKLMLPETFDLGYQETAVIGEMIDDLNALGLEIEHFRGNTTVVKSIACRDCGPGNQAPDR
ncbi:MAG: hypothetical protein R2861_01225 [Desulfobacterales bacterium]